MAIDRVWTGFEHQYGDSDFSTVAGGFSSAFIGNGVSTDLGTASARTGQGFCSFANLNPGAGNVFYTMARATVIGNAMALGVTATTKCRVFVRLNVAPGTTGCGVFGVGAVGVAPSNLRSVCLVNTSRQLALGSQAGTTAYSTTALTLGTWYRLEMTYQLTAGNGVTNSSVTSSLDIRDEGGTLLESVSHNFNFFVGANPSLPFSTIGNGTFTNSTFHIDYDDWFSCSGDGLDEVNVALPTATRVSRLGVTGQGSSAAWTGDFRTQVDTPRQQSGDEQSNAVVNATTTFTHDTCASQGVSGIEGVILRAQLRTAGASGTDALMLDGVQYNVTVPVGFTFPALTVSSFTSWSESQLDAAEFGARNLRGTSLRLASCYLEVLHGGTSVPAPHTQGVGGWKCAFASWTGNAGYQTISGVGFAPQIIIIKPTNGGAGLVGGWVATRSGGTVFSTNNGAVLGNGVIEVFNDGFRLGPDTQVNAALIDYYAVCFQDGGGAGYHLSSGSYIGTGGDNRNIVMPEPFSPQAVLVAGMGTGSNGGMRTSAMAGDKTMTWGNVVYAADMIQALNADGFQVGTNAGVNGVVAQLFWMALRGGTGLLDPFVHVGTFTPSGSSATITGLPFAPQFVLVKADGGGLNTPYWRGAAAPAHNGRLAGLWISGATVNNAVTSLTGDGFTIGSAIAAAGVPIYWLALVAGSLTSAGGCVVNLSNGADSAGGSGCLVPLIGA